MTVDDPLVAAPKFNSALHPRGRDGQFIKIGAIVKFLSGGKESSGTVSRIDPGSGGGKPDIRIKDNAGHLVTVQPNDVISSTSAKATLKPGAPSAPSTPDAGGDPAQALRDRVHGPTDAAPGKTPAEAAKAANQVAQGHRLGQSAKAAQARFDKTKPVSPANMPPATPGVAPDAGDTGVRPPRFEVKNGVQVPATKKANEIAGKTSPLPGGSPKLKDGVPADPAAVSQTSPEREVQSMLGEQRFAKIVDALSDSNKEHLTVMKDEHGLHDVMTDQDIIDQANGIKTELGENPNFGTEAGQADVSQALDYLGGDGQNFVTSVPVWDGNVKELKKLFQKDGADLQKQQLRDAKLRSYVLDVKANARDANAPRELIDLLTQIEHALRTDDPNLDRKALADKLHMFAGMKVVSNELTAVAKQLEAVTAALTNPDAFFARVAMRARVHG